MSREAHVRFWESAGVKFPRATHLPLAPLNFLINYDTSGKNSGKNCLTFLPISSPISGIATKAKTGRKRVHHVDSQDTTINGL